MSRTSEDVGALPVAQPWRGRRIIFVGIVLLALNLRLPVVSVSPILDIVRADIALSDTLAGLLGSIPVFSFALFGAVTPAIVRRLGLERSVVLALVVGAGGEVARAFSTGAPTFLLWTTFCLAGMGMGNILLPPLVKKYFPDRIGLVTAVYSVTLSLSATLPPLVVVSMARTMGWRPTLGGWVLGCLIALVPWAIVISRSVAERRQSALADGQESTTKPARSGRTRTPVWRSPITWGLAGMHAINSLNTYTLFAWLPRIFVDAGLSEQSGATYLSVYAFIGIPMSFIVPPLAVRMRHPIVMVVTFSVTLVGAYVALAFAPTAAPILWCVLLGIGTASFPLMLALLNLRSATHEGAVALSGFVQALGYLLAGIGPLVVGALYGASGTWTSTYILLSFTALAAIGAGALGCRRGTVEDSWKSPAEDPVGAQAS